MSEASKITINQALELTAAERAIVAEQILISLEQPDAEIDAIWVTETEARLDAYDKGHLASVHTRHHPPAYTTAPSFHKP